MVPPWSFKSASGSWSFGAPSETLRGPRRVFVAEIGGMGAAALSDGQKEAFVALGGDDAGPISG